MEETKPKLNLLQYTTIIYALLTFLGYSYLDTYYNLWGIRIYPFLDASEILLIFLNNLNIVLTIIVYIVLFVITFMYFNYKQSKNNVNNETNITTSQKIAVYILLTALVSFGVYLIIKNYSIYTLMLCLVIFLLAYSVYFAYNTESIINKYKLPFNKVLLQIMLFIGISYFINNTGAFYEYNIVNDLKSKTTFSLSYESKTYQSNDSLLYIGATSKYIFIRNTKSINNLIFEKTNIKNLSLVENKPK